MKTNIRLVRDGQLIKTIDGLSEPSMVKDIMLALQDDLRYSGYGEYDIITKAQFYLYDNVKHWIIELVDATDDFLGDLA